MAIAAILIICAVTFAAFKTARPAVLLTPLRSPEAARLIRRRPVARRTLRGISPLIARVGVELALSRADTPPIAATLQTTWLARLNTRRKGSPRTRRSPPARAPTATALRIGLPEARHLLQLSPARLDRQRHPASRRPDRVTYKPLLDIRQPVGKTISAAAKARLQGRGTFALTGQMDARTAAYAVDDLREAIPLPPSALLQV